MGTWEIRVEGDESGIEVSCISTMLIRWVTAAQLGYVWLEFLCHSDGSFQFVLEYKYLLVFR